MTFNELLVKAQDKADRHNMELKELFFSFLFEEAHDIANDKELSKALIQELLCAIVEASDIKKAFNIVIENMHEYHEEL